MKTTFIELPPFERHRQSYLNDESFHEFQKMLMKNPEAGDVIEGTGGLRKIRYSISILKQQQSPPLQACPEPVEVGEG